MGKQGKCELFKENIVHLHIYVLVSCFDKHSFLSTLQTLVQKYMY
jgi:hypothetical protein